MIKVLIVDDSSFMRNTIARLLADCPDVEIVGQAKNGREGLDMVQKLSPDIITLDIEMPIMDGLTMLEELMKTMPTPVLMVSSLTTAGAEATFRALDLGALDFIPKYTDSSFSTKNLQEELCQKIQHVSRRAKYMRHKFSQTKTAPTSPTKPSTTLGSTQTSTLSSRPSAQSTSATKTFGTSCTTTTAKPATAPLAKTESPKVISLPAKPLRRNIVGIGVSTGGPPAIQQVLMQFPDDFPAAILIAQHMPASFTKAFAQRLDNLCKIRVKEAEDGEKVQLGTAYIAPGGAHMGFTTKGTLPYIRISEEPTTELYKPSANVLFDGLSHFSAHSLGVIMTGMGSDGVVGLKTFKEKGGVIIAQDEESCVVYGMPKAAVDAGLANEIKSLDNIAQAIISALYK